VFVEHHDTSKMTTTLTGTINDRFFVSYKTYMLGQPIFQICYQRKLQMVFLLVEACENSSVILFITVYDVLFEKRPPTG
jgi:hypothetical protein